MDTTFPYKPSTIAKAFSERIHAGSFEFKNSDVTSVLEFLYIAYTDVQGRDPREIDEGFIALDNQLEGVSLDVNNTIFSIVCDLCNAYEKRTFLDAVQIGAHLILEILME